ncbi:hypothetical protein QFZ22_000891 [Streptomyces canus]|uniref:Uncharacterized protein n=1 Tax=Streptomyces canus TaxID=58343 RepID=A0AAW8F4B6_9ACTN|nr:hypothetical protein [Streptomyces canus]MDQ0904906.1 hypothetical protein [Streptomyces canus]
MRHQYRRYAGEFRAGPRLADRFRQVVAADQPGEGEPCTGLFRRPHAAGGHRVVQGAGARPCPVRHNSAIVSTAIEGRSLAF